MAGAPGYALGPVVRDFRTLPYAVMLYAGEKWSDAVEDVDVAARDWPVLQWALILGSAALIFTSLWRLWRTCIV